MVASWGRASTWMYPGKRSRAFATRATDAPGVVFASCFGQRARTGSPDEFPDRIRSAGEAKVQVEILLVKHWRQESNSARPLWE